MGLFINTNVVAINAQRNLATTNAKMGKALERLSSGLRINRAADDAAGLAISEKMRAQVRGLQQGLRNAQDGISMLQTAEGALSEVHNILQRMRELTVQAGNSTLSASDRTAIGEEMVALKNEVDNIVTRTRFNGLSLLNGDLTVGLDATSTASAVVADNGGTGEVSVTSIEVGGALAGATYTFEANGDDLTLSRTVNGYTTAQTLTVAAMGQNATQSLAFNQMGVTLNLAQNGDASTVTAAQIATAFDTSTVLTEGDGNATFRVGSEATDNITVAFGNMQADALGNGPGQDISTLAADNAAVSTVAKADDLLAAIDTAIGQVSTQRAKLGAAQNQMESAIASLGVAVENLSASESRIRDADVAQLSSELVTRQIMQQAGVSVLAQANSAPQAVLALIQR